MALCKLQHVYFCMLKLEGLKLVASKLTMHMQTLNFISDDHVQWNLGKWCGDKHIVKGNTNDNGQML